MAGILAALAISACSPLPYETAIPKAVERELRPYAEDDGPSAPNAPKALSFCYSEALNTPEELMNEARLLCPNGKLTLHGTDIVWTPCSLLQPSRATFFCTPESATSSP